MAVMSPLFNALRASRPAHRVKNTLRSLDDKLMNLPALRAVSTFDGRFFTIHDGRT